MLTHIVCWKYKQETTEEQKGAHFTKLKELPKLIPEIISFSLGRDILHLDRSYDLGLSSVFADRESLESYSIHPDHQSAALFGKEISAQIISVDFVNDPDI